MTLEGNFDIQQIKNSSRRQKNALQAEWQETSMSADRSGACALLQDLTLVENEFPSMLPNVVLALNYRNRAQAGGGTSANPVFGVSANAVADWSH